MNLVKPYTHMFMSDNTTADIFNTSCFGKDNTTVTSDPRVGYLNESGSVIGDGAGTSVVRTLHGQKLPDYSCQAVGKKLHCCP